MKAVALTQYLPITDSNAFQDIELPKPEATGNDLLVRVKAVSVNPVDTKIRRGGGDKTEYPPRVLAGMPVVSSRPWAIMLHTSSQAMTYTTRAT